MADLVDLPDGWRATFEQAYDWLCIRLHPPGGPGQWRLAERLWAEIQCVHGRRVVLEMDEVSFFPSALMGELVRLHKRLAMAGGVLHLSALQPHPHEAMHMSRLDEVLPCFASRTEAMGH
ncbi:MAG: STAS domain-containing protein [Planctomycetota bacterium]